MGIPPISQQGQAGHVSYKAGGGLVVQSLPDEIGIPVRRYQFDILCEGGIGEAKAGRDVNIGVCAASFAGLVGVLVAIDWDIFLAHGHTARTVLSLVSIIILFAIVMVSATGICIYETRRRHTLADSPYSREKARLLKLYEAKEVAAAHEVNLLETSVEPASISHGKALRITYRIECSDDIPDGIWLGASYQDKTGKYHFNTNEDRIVPLTKGSQAYQRNLTIATDAPLGRQLLKANVWQGVVGDSQRSRWIAGKPPMPIEITE